jgi:hypothetical protein
MSYQVNPLIVGSMLGMSNLGFGIPDSHQIDMAVQRVYVPLNKNVPADLDTMVEIFAGHLVESDDHYAYFRDEFEGWVQYLTGNEAVVQNTHRPHWEAFQRAMNAVGSPRD